MKVKAPVDGGKDPDTLIIARTDAIAVQGLSEALERAKRYEDAGADVIFVEAPTSSEEMAQICRTVSVPCLANMVEGGNTPLLPNAQLQALGYRLVLYPNLVTRIVARHVQRALASLRDHGSSQTLMPDMTLFPETNQLLGIEELNQMEQMYAVD